MTDPIRYLSWPGALLPAVKSQSRSRQSVTVSTESAGGINSDTSLRRVPKIGHLSQFVIGGEQDERLDIIDWIMDEMNGAPGRLWYQEEKARTRGDVYLASSDGSRVSYQVPISDPTDGPYIYVDKGYEPDAIIGTTASNVLTDDMAIAYDSLAGINTFGLCAHNRVSYLRYYYGRGLEMVPGTTTTNYGFKSDPVPCLATWPITGLYWARGSGSATKVRVRIFYYDISLVEIGVDTSPEFSIFDDRWTGVSFQQSTPSNAAYAALSGYCSSTSNSPWWCDCRGLMHLDAPHWLLPSESMVPVLLPSSPTAGAIIEASGRGFWKSLCSVEDSVESEIFGMANESFRSIRFREAWEVQRAT